MKIFSSLVLCCLSGEFFYAIVLYKCELQFLQFVKEILNV